MLARHGRVKQAVVLAREDERGEKRLLAYVVPHSGSSSSTEDLRAYLKEQLPDYMVPAAMVSLAKLPLNANGKIDRQALPAPEQTQSKAYVAPRTPTEEVVAHIWAEVLRRDRISTDDNFFELGGHSLMATQIVSRVREHFRSNWPCASAVRKTYNQGLAEAIETAQRTALETPNLPSFRWPAKPTARGVPDPAEQPIKYPGEISEATIIGSMLLALPPPHSPPDSA